jgi:hypothetical protein
MVEREENLGGGSDKGRSGWIRCGDMEGARTRNQTGGSVITG